MTRLTFSFVILILGIIPHIRAQVSQYNTMPLLPQYRFNAVYVDTMTIKSPILVNLNGFAFITPAQGFNSYNPASCLKKYQTCFMICNFYNHEVYGFYNSIDFYVSPMVTGELLGKQNHERIFPSFRFSRSYSDCEVYKCEYDSLIVQVFLMRCNSFNDMLNPLIEWENEYIDFGTHKIESQFPDLEYIRVAIPIKIKPKEKEQ